MPETKQLLRETRDRIAPPPDVLDGLERRRRHQENVKRVAAAAVAIVVALLGFGGWFLLDPRRRAEARQPFGPRDLHPGRRPHRVQGPTGHLGRRPRRACRVGEWRVQLTSDPATPLGWSSDGTELLIQ